MKTVHRELPIKLSAKEISDMAQDLAKRTIALMALEGQYKALQMEWRKRIVHAKGAVKDCAEGIENQVRHEMTKCSETYDPDSQKIILTRNDTGEKIEFRAASEEEMLEYEQGTLQGDLLRDSDDADQADEG